MVQHPERIKTLKPIRSRRRKQRFPVVVDVSGRTTRKVPIRSRRRLDPVTQPDDILEERAADVDGSILERVVYAELVSQLNGTAGFIYKKGALGGRLFRGGIEMDFLVTARHPNIAIEVLGAQWHGPSVQFADAARAIVIRGLLGEDGIPIVYQEINEWEIRMEPQFLEEKISRMLGNAMDTGVPFF